MSHDHEASRSTRDARLAVADLYVFDADSSTVFVMTVRVPSSGQESPDLLLPGARYEFKIHLDHHEREDLTYRVTFMPAQHDSQPYVVERAISAGTSEVVSRDTVIARGITGQLADTTNGGRVWAGWAIDPFYLDLRQLRAIEDLVRHGAEMDMTRWVRGAVEDSFSRSTVRAIVLSVPVGTDGLSTGRQVSTWAATELATATGEWQQVGRYGLPLICEIFGPVDGDGAGPHEHTHPADDAVAYGPAVADLVAATVERLGTSSRPGAYADSVMERIVPDVIPYVVGSPAVFGFARFNGRGLADNAAEVVFSLATNTAVPTGLTVTGVHRSQAEFPYVVPA